MNEISSPYTVSPDDDFEEEIGETTTHDPGPFFEEFSTQTNVTTQFGSHVLLNCKINDLRGKTVSIVTTRKICFRAPNCYSKRFLEF